MSTLRRPSMADRATSTPLFINLASTNLPNSRKGGLSRLGLDVLTPPASPRHSRSSSDLSTGSNESTSDESSCHRSNSGRSFILSSGRVEDGALICPFEVEILQDQRGRNQTFGYGAWSTVFRGTCRAKTISGVATPPLSPTEKPPLLVAVKQPARKDATVILRNEAKILTHLMFEPDNEHYIVPFYGHLSDTSSLVLAAIPLSLEEHIKARSITANASRTTWNMTEPVIGSTTVWLDLADKLVSGLSWLHNNAMVVHGDVKPGNILLNRVLHGEDTDTEDDNKHFLYKPLFADFSSSQRRDDEITQNTLSAVTREYTAPELLSSKVLLDPKSTATTDSDVFSLAVTLLVAATGNTMVYSGGVFQRQAMATQGWMVIQSARNGPMEQGARVPRQGVVERALDRAVLRQGMGRINASSWKTRIEEMVKGEPTKL